MSSGATLPMWKLLNGPGVAVGIAEEHEPSPREVLHIADLHPALGQLGAAGLIGIVHDGVHALHRTRVCFGQSPAEGDRAR